MQGEKKRTILFTKSLHCLYHLSSYIIHSQQIPQAFLTKSNIYLFNIIRYSASFPTFFQPTSEDNLIHSNYKLIHLFHKLPYRCFNPITMHILNLWPKRLILGQLLHPSFAPFPLYSTITVYFQFFGRNAFLSCSPWYCTTGYYITKAQPI